MYLDMINENYQCTDSCSYNESVLKILNEAYYGKTPPIMAIENHISKMRKTYKMNPEKVNASKEMKQLDAMIEDTFGFEGVSVGIKMSSIPNACTYPISNNVFYKNPGKCIISDRNGIKYLKDAKFYTIIYMNNGLFFNDDYTDGEVMALLLHEIGHNFQTAISPSSRNLTAVANICNIIQMPLMIINPAYLTSSTPLRNVYISFVKEFKTKHSDFIQSWDQFLNAFHSSIETAFFAINIVSNAITMIKPSSIITSIKLSILKNISSNNLFMPAGFRNEAISDEFASSFGYGSELSTVLEKIKSKSNGILSDQLPRDNLPQVLDNYFDLLTIPDNLIQSVFDPHPNSIARIKKQYDFIKKEMDKEDISPKVRAQMKKDMKEIEITIDKYLDAEQKGFFFTNTLAKGMYMLFGGDFRNIFSINIDKEYDNVKLKAEERAESLKASKR